MFQGLILSLLLGWLLSWFGFDYVVSKGLNELFKLDVSEATYYLIFSVLGLIYGAIHF